MNLYFTPYEGTQPYVFISYAHLDSVRVLPLIHPLHERRYRTWYDEGIPAGSDWPANIALHMRHCKAVLFFVSLHSLSSSNCQNEIAAAVKQHKQLFCMRLDDTPLSPKWEYLLQGATCLSPQNNAILSSDPEGFAEWLLADDFLDNSFLGDGKSDPGGIRNDGKFNGWFIAVILGVLLLFASAGGMYGFANGYFDSLLPAQSTAAPMTRPTPTSLPTAVPTPVPTIDVSVWGTMFNDYAVFPDALQERGIRSALGQPEGDVLTSDLYQIKELHFCGNMALRSDAGIRFSQDGECSVNGAPVIQGEIADLSLLSEILTLTRLTLAYQNVNSLNRLGSLTQLTELDVAGNPLATIGTLDGMVSLTTLHLEHTKVADLTPLNTLPRLTAVTVSADMFPLTTDPATQRYDIILVH